MLYASYALLNPERLKIVSAVDPDKSRLHRASEIHHIPSESLFTSIYELLDKPKTADAVINGTMDKLHVQTSLPLLKAGYDILLEKPIGVNKEEVQELLSASRATDKTVMICHVLRYAPFYMEIKRRINGGDLGEIINILTQENVSYHHMAVSFVRGKWSNSAHSSSSMLMAKSCHDLDLLSWIKSGIKPVKTSSFGNLMYFRPEKAPEGSGKRCMTDCGIEKSCPYSAYKNYVEQGLWGAYVWEPIEEAGKPMSLKQKTDSLKTDNIYGRCVWHCDNDVVDHQVVLVEFEDGCTASHAMTGNTSRPCRYIHITGTKGEIEGVMEDGYFTLRNPDARKGSEYTEEIITAGEANDQHGGGDLRLVDDFVNLITGGDHSISATVLEDSINGHLIGFAANESNDRQKVVVI